MALFFSRREHNSTSHKFKTHRRSSQGASVSSQSLIAVYSCVIPLSSALLLLVQKSSINLHDAISYQSSPACVAFTESLNVSHSCYTQLASLPFFTIL